MTPTLNTLNTSFAITNALRFSEAVPGLPVADVRTPLASASVALQGGHVLTWQPAGQSPVLWVSKAAVFAPEQPVRGGVPVCWPWFGAVPGKATHGFVRTRMWQVRGTELDATGQVVLRLGLSDDASTRALWDHAFDLEMVVTVGSTLTMALTTRNTHPSPSPRRCTRTFARAISPRRPCRGSTAPAIWTKCETLPSASKATT